MGSLILCRGKVTDNPLIIEGTGIRLYTAEELCYYIYNNIYLISSDFINDRLVEFLKDVSEEALAARIKELIEKKAGLAEMVVVILKTIDFYSVAQIEQIREILNTLGTQNVCERLKSRGDSFLFNDCYFNAIKCYTSIVKDYKGAELSGAQYAKVYHNMGVAYARMFLYDEAAENFKAAYKVGQYEDSKNCYLAAVKLSNKDKGPENDDASEEEYVVNREIETLMDNARYSEEYRKLENVSSLKEDGKVSEYNQELNRILSGWKSDYLKYSKTF